MGWGDPLPKGLEVDAVLRIQVKELTESYDTLWHRHADLKRQCQRLLTTFDTAHGGEGAGVDLARGLRLALSDHMERPPVASPHQMRLKHLRWRSEWTAEGADEDPVAQ